MHSFVSMRDLSKDNILDILKLANEFKNGFKSDILKDKVIASCFFEASTRTRLSFDSAIAYLGGKSIGFTESGNTSLGAKGESLVDTLKIIAGYADALIIRHPLDGAAVLAQEICSIPVINAGDGANQHPTQTLLDLFSIFKTQGSLDGVSLGIMGDLKYSRTVHSLLYAATLFNMKLYFISPPSLRMKDEQLFILKQSGVQYSFHADVSDVIGKLDCLYLTRLQKERFDLSVPDLSVPDLSVPDLSVPENYKLSLSMLDNAKPNLKILHPLPRQGELPIEIDNTPYAYYFQQAQNGLYVRQAILSLLF